jgi:hypothetical protein
MLRVDEKHLREYAVLNVCGVIFIRYRADPEAKTQVRRS